MFRVTVHDLETRTVQALDVAAGDYLLLAFEPCHLRHTQRRANGTVQLTLGQHHPAAPAVPVELGEAPSQRCSGCGRLTWAVEVFGGPCVMRQPDSSVCGGRFEPAGGDRG